MTSPEFETADDLDFILDIIYTLEIPEPPERYLALKNAIKFSQKWEVETVITRIRQVITAKVANPSDPDQLEHMWLALLLGDGALAAASFKPRPNTDFWEHEVGTKEVDEKGEPLILHGQNVFELGAADFQSFCDIGPRAVWIIWRARCLAEGPGRAICKNEKEFAVQLERLMKKYCELHPATIALRD
jgi:hypothetical protein